MTNSPYTPTQAQNDHARRWLPLIQPLTQARAIVSRAVTALTQAGRPVPQEAAETLQHLDSASAAAGQLFTEAAPPTYPANMTTAEQQAYDHGYRSGRRDTAQAASSSAAGKAALSIRIDTSATNQPAGKVADAEIHWSTGPLAGLKLIGFSVWQRRSGSGLNVTFPARQYSVNGERRSFALLRPGNAADGAQAQDRIRDLILDAYRRHEEANAVTPTTWTYTDAGTCLEQPPTPGLSRADLDSGANYSTVTTSPDQDPPIGQDEQPAQEQNRIGFTQPLQQAAQAIAANPRLDPGTVIASAIAQATTGGPGPMPPRPRRF